MSHAPDTPDTPTSGTHCDEDRATQGDTHGTNEIHL